MMNSFLDYKKTKLEKTENGVVHAKHNRDVI